MRYRLLVIALSSLAIVSCSATSSSPGPTSASPGATPAPTDGAAGGDIPSLNALVEQTVWPLVQPVGPGIAVELAGSGHTETIGSSGGTVEVAGSDGTRYTLTIPANALTFETDITLTPVAALTGYSVDADAMYGVDIAPHGLMLWEAATLAVVPAAGTDVAHAVALAYDGSGANLHRTPLGRDASKIELVVPHFSGELVYVGDGIYVPALPAPQPLSYDELASAVAEAIERERAGDATPEETSAAVEALLDRYIRDSLVPNRDRMRDDCAYGKQNLWKYVAVTRQAQLLGMEHVLARYTDDVNASGVIGDVIEACWKVKTGECVRYDPAQIREIIGLLRQAQIIGRDLDVEQYAPSVCGNVGGQITWSSDGADVITGDPWTLTTKDHYESTIWVTGEWTDDFYEDRGSTYTYQGLSTQSDVGGGCDVYAVNRVLGEGRAQDVTLEVTGNEAYFYAWTNGTAYGTRTDCDGTTNENQPDFGAMVTCPDESGGVTGTFDAVNRQAVFNCDHTTTDDTGSSSFAVHGWLSLQGYQDIIDFITSQAAAQ